MPPSIRVNHLSKYYSIEALNKHLSTDSEAGVVSKTRIHPQKGFAALEEVSFDIESGKAIGLIGSNGAGKSTLLRILAGITIPSSGTLEVNGRVAALLTLLGGMDPRLSGRKNIYLHGALLGLSRSEIESHVDEIIDFADLGDFIHAPMASYSTGMRARLAFSASMHLQSEVLLVDEVLAVGDKAFQEKALQAMRGYFEQGNTVIIASHNVNILRGLCNQLLWLEDGNLHLFGETEEVLPEFLEAMQSSAPVYRNNAQNIIEQISSFNALGIQRRRFPVGESIQLEIKFTGINKLTAPLLEVTFIDFVSERTVVTVTSDQFIEATEWRNSGVARLIFEGVKLPPRQYRFEVTIYDQDAEGKRLKVDKQLFSLMYYDPDEAAVTVKDIDCKMLIT